MIVYWISDAQKKDLVIASQRKLAWQSLLAMTRKNMAD